jgi:membrane-anchored glycerophosphoryl diester phosphodiesterase (GDPDase)
VGLLALYVIANLILVIGNLIAVILLMPALVQAGYLVARQGQSSFGEAFGDLSLLLKVFVYLFILLLIPGILIGLGYVLGLGATVAGVAAAYAETYTEGGNEAMSGVMALGGTGGILVVAGLIILFILNLFGWAGPYAILSGRAGVFRAIGQSFSLTARNFGKVFLALLWYMVLAILGSLLCGLGLLVVVLTGYVFWPLLYLALTGEEGVSHS